MPKMGSEGGKNADSKVDNSELDPLDDLPEPSNADFEDTVGDVERRYYLDKFAELKNVKQSRLHCTACDKHLGLLTRHTNRYRMHPMLRTLVCISCQDFYSSGEFEKGEDGSELYCRWCGQGGQVYCCASCPIVFCEKCIKRNFGVGKINEIESNDDWCCFACNSKPLWFQRAKYWVLILYCNFKNTQAQTCTDPSQKVILMRKCQVDESDCCKRNAVKTRPAQVIDIKKRVSIEPKKSPVVKPPPPAPAIPEKKSISISEVRQAMKRLGSPVSIKKVTVNKDQQSLKIPSVPLPMPQTSALKVGIPGAPMTSITPMAPVNSNPLQFAPKRLRMNSPMPIVNPLVPRFGAPGMGLPRQDKPRQPRKPAPQPMYNGYGMPQPINIGLRDVYAQSINNDNLNLSLDNLTHGIDMALAKIEAQQLEAKIQQEEEAAAAAAAAAALAAANPEPPEEPPQESRFDDDVQCLTPTPKLIPKPLSALTDPKSRQYPALLPSSAFSNIIEMTDNDVTINKETGGLKFKVDPSTLSSSKMYKLPDGRIFAVNNNPNMPGGYSATIVAVDEASLMRAGGIAGIATRSQRLQRKQQNKVNTPPPAPKAHTWTTPVVTPTKRSKAPPVPAPVSAGTNSPDPSTTVAGSVEWFKFNVVDAIDVMNYVLNKLYKLRNSSPELRSKSILEIKELHQTFDQMLKTSVKRFGEVKLNLNQGFKSWLKDKNCVDLYSDDDEDEVQILPSEGSAVHKGTRSRNRNKSKPNDEPIFIDENSGDSVKHTEVGEQIDKTAKDESSEEKTGGAGDVLPSSSREHSDTSKDKDAAPSEESTEVSNGHESQELDRSTDIQDLDTNAEVQESDKSAEVQESDSCAEVQESDRSAEVQESDNCAEVQESDRSAEVQESDNCTEVQESDKSADVQESDRSAEVQESNESKEVQESNKSMEVQESNKSMDVQESDKCAEVQESDKSMEALEIDKGNGKEVDDSNSSVRNSETFDSKNDKNEESMDSVNDQTEDKDLSKDEASNSGPADEQDQGEDSPKEVMNCSDTNDQTMEELEEPKSTLANGNIDKNGETASTDTNSKTIDDSMGEDMIDRLLEDSTDQMDVDSGLDDLHKYADNSLSDVAADGESRDNSEKEFVG